MKGLRTFLKERREAEAKAEAEGGSKNISATDLDSRELALRRKADEQSDERAKLEEERKAFDDEKKLTDAQIEAEKKKKAADEAAKKKKEKEDAEGAKK